MNTKVLLFFALALLFSACENKEKKAYENAAKSNEMAVLRQYLEMYQEKASNEHIDSITTRLILLTQDSVDFSLIINASDISERYDYEIEYLQNNPQGLHFAEVDSMRKTDEPAYIEWVAVKQEEEAKARKMEQYEMMYGKFRDRMKNFTYRYSRKDGGSNYFLFDIPDENGKGIGALIKEISWNEPEWNSLTYEIQDNDDVYLRLKNGSRVIVNLYSDCLYVNAGGETLRFNRVLIIDEYPEYIKKIRKL